MKAELQYSPEYVQALSDKLAKQYWLIGLLSFGVNRYWRGRCIRRLPITDASIIADLGSGAGNNWRMIKSKHKEARIYGVDFSGEMNRAAAQKIRQNKWKDINILEENFLHSSVADNSVDIVLSSFGLKTLSCDDIGLLAQEINRILKKGGCFSLVEISVPCKGHFMLRLISVLYLKSFVKWVARLLLGNKQVHEKLFYYAESLPCEQELRTCFNVAGLDVNIKKYSFGLAVNIYGRKD